jgi:thiamine kinase-like enzyme
MIGIAYLLDEQATAVKAQLKVMDKDSRYENAFWEETLQDHDRMIVNAKVVSAEQVVEINTYEQLRELDGDSRQLNTTTMQVAANALSVKPKDITNIEVLKKGMTNRSFTFECKGKRYIMRIPGEGTDQLINRREEASVYRTLEGQNICENVLYINPENGYKVTEFFENARVCDPENAENVKKCMRFLRKFHQKQLSVPHVFDIFEKINFYESLWNGQPSAFRDYDQTKQNIFSLKKMIDQMAPTYCLTHIDAVPDNFLFYPDTDGQEKIRLIDWEYAAMQDPHVDIAMFAIYAMYDREQVEALIDAYFEGNCPSAIRKKIYAYIAACGLLWSNWCEYKRQLGVEFGEYSLAQYRYAKTYYKIATED